MGKSRLAIQAAGDLDKHFADGVWFVDLAPLHAPDQIAGAILREFGLPPASPDSAVARLLEHLRRCQALLVLDNFEHLLAGAEFLPALLNVAPALKLLVTSRVRLHLAEEWLLPLGGLATPPATGTLAEDSLKHNEQEELTSFASIQLFLQRIERLDPSFQPTPAELQQIADICRLLDGMPLGIELAAAWVRSLSLAEITAAVRSRLQLFTTTLRNIPPRHRSMPAVFDHSWRLLDTHARGLLRQLAVFRGGWTCAAAAAVTGATPIELESLVDSSWVRVANQRFSLHELVRQYCVEKLCEEHELETGEPVMAVHRRHCAYYADLTGAEEQALNWQREPMARFSADFGNLEAAWMWAIDQGEFSATRQMMIGLFFFAEMMGWYSAMLPFFERAANALRTRWQHAGGDATARQETALLLAIILYIEQTLLVHLGWLARVQECVDEARAVLDGAIRDARWVEQDFLVRWATTCLRLEWGNFAVAHTSARELLAFLQTNTFPCYPYRAEIGTRFWQMQMHHMLGVTARLMGDHATAWTHSEAANALCDEMGEQRFKTRNLREIATLMQLRGENEQALSSAQNALALSQRFEDQMGVAYGAWRLGEIELDAGLLTLASEHCRHGLAVALETGEHKLHIRSLVTLARGARLSGQLAAARQRLEEALRACAQPDITHSNLLAAVFLELGHVACAEQAWAQARHFYIEALAVKGCDAAETQAAQAGLAEVVWADNKSEFRS